MRHLSLVFVLFVATLASTGCGKMNFSGQSARGGMAVVDLDKVAAETGRDRQLAASLETATNSLNQQLAKIGENAKEQLTAKKKSYGDDLSDEQKREYSAFESKAVTELSRIQNNARVQFEQFKQNQIAQFRAELRPIAQEIASKRGLSIVIPKNEGLLLSVDAGVDITEEVIKTLRERHPVQQTAKADTDSTEQKSSMKREAVKTADADADQSR